MKYVFEKGQQAVKNGYQKLQVYLFSRMVGDQRGQGTTETLILLGFAILVILATLWAARTPITNWWNNRVMPFWQ